MRPDHRFGSNAAALTLLVLLSAACTGGSGPSEPAPAPAAEAAPDTAAPDTASAGTVAGDRDAEATGPTGTGAEAADPGATDPEAAPAYPGEPVFTAASRAELPVPTLPGALLPDTRIVAFYGNPASRHMGILGELPPDEMLARLDAEVRAWRDADPPTPVRPALQMIAVMATGDPGRDSLFRLRMPDHRIRSVAEWASRRDALLFLDVQPGHSTVPAEVERLEKWLIRPDVHLALDPEWAMPKGVIPGRQIGSLTADDINWAIDFLARLVERHHLPPKVLIVHRFTASMVRRADEIRRDPRVQVVINMDGWGAPTQKRVAYDDIVAPEADQFTGFKLFFRNDTRNGSVLLTPAEILELDPAPIYIQYQ